MVMVNLSDSSPERSYMKVNRPKRRVFIKSLAE